MKHVYIIFVIFLLVIAGCKKQVSGCEASVKNVSQKESLKQPFADYMVQFKIESETPFVESDGYRTTVLNESVQGVWMGNFESNGGTERDFALLCSFFLYNKDECDSEGVGAIFADYLKCHPKWLDAMQSCFATLDEDERERILGFMLMALGLESEYAMIGKRYSSDELLKIIVATYPSFISLAAASGYDIVAEEGLLTIKGCNHSYFLNVESEDL